MNNPNGPSIEQIDDWNDALEDMDALKTMNIEEIRSALATWDNPHPEYDGTPATIPPPHISLDGKDCRLHSTRHLREWCQMLIAAVDELNGRLIERTMAYEERDRRQMRLLSQSSLALAKSREQAYESKLRALLNLCDAHADGAPDADPHDKLCARIVTEIKEVLPQ